MENSELKKQLIEMIEAIDDEELLYLVKEDFVFHATSKAMRSFEIITDEESHIFNAGSKEKLRVAGGKSSNDKSHY